VENFDPEIFDFIKNFKKNKSINNNIGFGNSLIKNQINEIQDLQFSNSGRGGNVLDDDIVFPALKRGAKAVDNVSDFIMDKMSKYTDFSDISKENKQFIFDNVRPLSYPNITTMTTTMISLMGKKLGINNTTPPSLDKDGDYTIGDEAWAMSLGLETKNKYIIKQNKYKPTKSKNPNAKYYALSDDVIDYEKLLKKIENKKVGDTVNVEGLTPYIREGFMDSDKFEGIDPLQNFQVSVGYDKDKKEKYISIYDKYDFKGPLESIVDEFEIYDRRYIKEEKGKYKLSKK